MSKQKLLLIGWDAADWQIIDPLIAQGRMPTLSKLLRSGSRGNIATLSPPLSPMLWTSIATGKRAYDHGVHGFVEARLQEDKILPVRATSRKVKAVWSILKEAGLKTHVINWWPSHPVEQLDGVVVSNQFHKDAPAFGEDWPLEYSAVHPAQYFEQLKGMRVHPAELGLQHILPFVPEAAELDPEKDKVLKPLMRVLAHCASVHNAATFAMEQEEWDFMAVYYEALDHFSHLAMKYHPPRLEGLDEREFDLYKGIVEAAYRYHDMMLERLLKLAGPDCTVILLSDHGFESRGLRELELPDLPAAPALEHRRYGILAAQGPGIKTNSTIYGASLLDISPTVLHHFGLPYGEDMEGRVLQDLFVKQNTISHIPSWELTPQKPEFAMDDPGESAAMLKQLEDLGYIDLQQKDKLKYVELELGYNLGLSLLEGNRMKEVAELAQEKYEDSSELRFALLWARALLRLGQTDELEQLLQQLDKEFPGQQAIGHFKGLLAIRLGEPQQAMDHFKAIEEKGLVSQELFSEMALAWLISGKPSGALGYFEKVLKLDPENTAGLSGRAQCLLELGKAEDALPDLEQSLELQFFQPAAHYLMAQAALAISRPELAVNALKICLKQAPRHKTARLLLEQLEGQVERVQQASVIVVSGFPRSGTSLLMKMLESSGLEALKDEERQADIHNPEGYFEYEKVKRLGLENDWVGQGRGKVIKVVAPLLPYLPDGERYKILWIKRPITEVIVSQEVMKGKVAEEVMKNFPFQLAMEMQEEEKRLKHRLLMRPEVELFELEYYDCLDRPEALLSEISDFLGLTLDAAKGKQAVNEKLHRNKLAR